jgi:Fe(3+) dicitrate transport protein
MKIKLNSLAKTSNKSATLTFIAASLISSGALAKQKVNTLPTIVVKEKADENGAQYEVPVNFPGSAGYISPEEISKRKTSDVNRVIREIPGVNVQEEDGYGLRPNIGIRGGRIDRSSDITLMEDGVLIAPAPYAASSAYYFPSMGRVKGIEVRKGSSSIKYGPRTTSGAINLLTTPIPEVAKGEFTASAGNFSEKNFNFNYGDSKENYGYVVNFDHASSDGFKELDGGGKTGYELNDFMTKFRINTDKDADIYQQLDFKIAANDETSNETYLGLTLEDFNQNAYRRYKASALDEMNAQHRQYQVSHYIEPAENFNLTTTIYRNEFKRNWYKLDKVSEGSGYESISNIFTNNGLSGAQNDYLAVIRGTSDGNLQIKANNREYLSHGIQSKAESKAEIGKTKHNFEYGVRFHYDEEDRLQHSDVYQMQNGEIKLSSAGASGSAGNKIASAEALSFFLEDEIKFDKWTIVPGARFEHIETKSRDYGSSDANRTNSPASVKNNEDAFVPGIAGSYQFTDNLALFGGVHKGFAPPSPSNNQAKSEESVNYELGGRFRDDIKFFETTFFFNDYSNLLGSDTNSSGGTGSGDQFNGGEVDAYGVEVAGGYNLKTKISQYAFNFPLRASYTFSDAEFKNSFNSSLSEWGNVKKGDKLPYFSRHQVALSAGLEVQRTSLYLSGKYVDKMRATAGKGEIAKSDKIPSHFVLDFTGFYEFDQDKKIFLAVDNILNNEYAVALRPAGLRPGKPLAARIGVTIGF